MNGESAYKTWKERSRRGLVLKLGSLFLMLAIVTAFVLYSASRVDWQIRRAYEVEEYVYGQYVGADQNGVLHMTYSAEYSTLGGALIHAVQTENGWNHEAVASGAIDAVPLAFDPEGHPHICYQTYDEGERFPSLMHIEYNGSQWTSSMVRNTSYPGSHSVFVDSAGVVHVAFISQDDIVYANDSAGMWTETTLFDVDTFIPDFARYGVTSVVADGSGNVHVAVTYNGASVTVFSNEGNVWNSSRLFDWDGTFRAVDIACDHVGNFLVSYWGYPLGRPDLRGLMLASKIAGSWDLESVDPEVDGEVSLVGCALYVDSDDRVQMAVLEREVDGPMVNAVYRQVGEAWVSETVWEYSDWSESLGRSQLSMCVDQEGDTVIPITRGFVEYADDSPDLGYSLGRVGLMALAGYCIGFLVWGATLVGLRFAKTRTGA